EKHADDLAVPRGPQLFRCKAVPAVNYAGFMHRIVAVMALAFGLLVPAARADEAFRIGLTAMPPQLGNPYGVVGTTSNFVMPAIYDRLAGFDNDGVLQPMLAVGWERRDVLTWAFNLRQGVVFSNGEPWNAHAAKSVLETLRGPQGVGLFGANEPRELADVIVEDDYTLLMTTAKPNAALPRNIYVVFYVPPKYLERVGIEGLTSQPIGSGPFVVDAWEPDKIELSANQTSWRPPKVGHLELRALPEAIARVQAAIAGEIDVAIAVDPVQIPALEAAGLRMAERTPARLLSIVFNTLKKGSPFADERVRQAVNYGVNRKAITEMLLAGLVEPASQGAIPGALGYDPDIKPYPYDPDKARALLKEAGYEKGFTFTFEMPGGATSADSSVFQSIASDLAKVGINMRIHVIPFAQFSKYYVQGGAEGEALPADYNLYAYDALRTMFGPSGTHGCDWSAPRFCDRAIQDVIDAAGTAATLEERVELTRQAVRAYHDTAESLLLFPVLGLDAIGPRVGHWETWADTIQYHTISLKP
ncbi:MAG: hypothetical protein KDE14_02405, partial [Rhodobacteraceae bacterium]|nr:hypothetical protein [Paracoccaceae bacterium]